jgi:hypothetical protein
MSEFGKPKGMGLKGPLVVVAILALIGLGGLLLKNKIGGKSTKDNNASKVAEAQSVYAQVQKIWTNPFPEEKPVVSLVSDLTKLQKNDPELFKNAAVGDYVLTFPSRILVFRKSDNKIVGATELLRAPAAKVSSTPVPSVSPTPKQ